MRIKIALFDYNKEKVCDVCTYTTEDMAIKKCREMNFALGHEYFHESSDNFWWVQKAGIPIAMIDG